MCFECVLENTPKHFLDDTQYKRTTKSFNMKCKLNATFTHSPAGEGSEKPNTNRPDRLAELNRQAAVAAAERERGAM